MQRGRQNADNGLTKRRIDIRNKIRRDQLDQYFQKRRRELLELRSQLELPSTHQQIMLSPERREQFLLRIEAELKSTSPQNWLTILQQLNTSIGYFQGDFDPWMRSSIIEILTSVIKGDSQTYDLQLEIIKLYTTIINTSRQSASGIVLKLVYFGVIQNTINFINRVRMPLMALKKFLHFFGTLCRANIKLRNEIVNMNGGDWLIGYGTQLIISQYAADQNELYDFLGICGDFLPFEAANNRLNDTVTELLPLVFECISTKVSERVIKEGLFCMYQISKYKRNALQEKFQDPAILQFLFQYSKIEPYQCLTINILTKLTFDSSKGLVQALYRMKIFDLFQEIATLQKRNYLYLNSVITIINNLVVDQAETSILIAHPIWKTVTQAVNHFSHKVREHTYHCIHSILVAADSNETKLRIFHQANILHSIINQISQWRKGETGLTREAMELLKYYICVLIEERKRGHLKMLHMIYKLDEMLSDLMDHGLNDAIVEEATQINLIYAEGVFEQT